MPLTDTYDTTPASPKTLHADFGARTGSAAASLVSPFVVRVASSGASGPATDEIAVGDTIDDVVIGEGDRILRYGTNDYRDGVFVIGAEGVQTIAAPEADEEAEMPAYVKVLEGTAKGGKVFSLEADWPDVVATQMATTPATIDLLASFSAAGALPKDV